MKAILMSIKPKWVAKILNGEKTIEIRKKFSKDYVGWVYIYCTKGNGLTEHHYEYVDENGNPTGEWYKVYDYGLIRFLNGRVATLTSSTCSRKEELESGRYLNGKVVARFWCDKVGNFSKEIFGTYEEPFTYNQDDLLKKSCLTEKELDDYLQGKNGYAIHITKLEIFDKPKEISEFYTTRLDQDITKLFDNSIQLEDGTWVKSLTRAPQSWCYIYE